MHKPEITSVRIEAGDTKLEITPSQAKNLWRALGEMVGDEGNQTSHPLLFRSLDGCWYQENPFLNNPLDTRYAQYIVQSGPLNQSAIIVAKIK